MLAVSPRGSTKRQLLLRPLTVPPKNREEQSFWAGQAERQARSPGKGPTLPRHCPTTAVPTGSACTSMSRWGLEEEKPLSSLG